MRWFWLAEAAERHFADMDVLHNHHEPRHWGDGIIFGHSYHDEEGFLNPHRNYGGAAPDTAYGMPGMLLAYYLTGYQKTYDSAMEIADCIEYRLRNDFYLCPYITSGACSGQGWGLYPDGLYASGSRPIANSLTILVAAYRATSEQRYLAVADSLVAFADPERQTYINGPTGTSGEEDHMKPWQMNLYLRSLTGYLEMRQEFGLDDIHNGADDLIRYVDWLHEYAWIDLDPIDSIQPRAAFPQIWFFDERQGNINDEWDFGNNIPSINNWLLLSADSMAYAYHLSGDPKYLDWAAALFRTGIHDPFFPGDPSLYTQTKQMINSVVFGNIFLYEWHIAQD
jgi:hypothetical protein